MPRTREEISQEIMSTLTNEQQRLFAAGIRSPATLRLNEKQVALVKELADQMPADLTPVQADRLGFIEQSQTEWKKGYEAGERYADTKVIPLIAGLVLVIILTVLLVVFRAC